METETLHKVFPNIWILEIFWNFFLKFSATKGKNGSGLTLSCCRDFILKYAMKIYNNSFCWSKTGVFKGLSGNFV